MSEPKSTGRKPGFNAAKKEGEVGFQPALPVIPVAPTPALHFPDGTPVTKENRGFEGGDWEAQHAKMLVAKEQNVLLAKRAMHDAFVEWDTASGNMMQFKDGTPEREPLEEIWQQTMRKATIARRHFLSFKSPAESEEDFEVRVRALEEKFPRTKEVITKENRGFEGGAWEVAILKQQEIFKAYDAHKETEGEYLDAIRDWGNNDRTTVAYEGLVPLKNAANEALHALHALREEGETIDDFMDRIIGEYEENNLRELQAVAPKQPELDELQKTLEDTIIEYASTASSSSLHYHGLPDPQLEAIEGGIVALRGDIEKKKNDVLAKSLGLSWEAQAKIDAMSYEDMLRKQRFAPIGDPLFAKDNPVSEYFEVRMKQLREKDPAEAVAASKRIGH